MGTLLLVLSFIAVGSIAACIGVVIGAVLASSKVADLHTRLEQSEKIARQQAQLLDSLREVLAKLLDEVGNAQPEGVAPKSFSIASDLLARVGTSDRS